VSILKRKRYIQLDGIQIKNEIWFDHSRRSCITQRENSLINMSFWFQPNSSPPTLACYYSNGTNQDPRHRRRRDEEQEEGESELNMDHDHYQSNQGSWAARSLVGRIQQLISPMTSSSSSFSSLFPPSTNNTAARYDSSGTNTAAPRNLEQPMLLSSYPHPSFHFHLMENQAAMPYQTNVHKDASFKRVRPHSNLEFQCDGNENNGSRSSETLTNYWQHVQFFHPRPIETLDQNVQQVNNIIGFENHPTTTHRTHSFMASSKTQTSTHTLLPPSFSATILDQDKDSSTCTINAQRNQVLNPTSSSILSRHEPFAISDDPQHYLMKKNMKGTNHTQATISRDGQLALPRVPQPLLGGHNWDQVQRNISTYKSSVAHDDDSEQQQQQRYQKQQQEERQPTKKRKVFKERPLPNLNAMSYSPNITAKQRTMNHHHDDDDDDNNNTAPKPPRKKTNKGQRSSPINSSKGKSVKKKDTQKPRIDHLITNGDTRKTIDIGSKFKTIPKIEWQTFQILEEVYHLNNAGTNMDCLRRFLEMVQDKGLVAWTIIFHDQYCTSPFLPMNKRYCTEKGPPCTMWNCTCDQQVRAIQSSKPIAGVLFCLPPLDKTHDDSLSNFFLPLGPTSEMDDNNNVLEDPGNLDPGYERMIHWPLLPIRCETSLKQRWDAFRSILMNKFVTCVTYNAVMGLMPYHYHCLNDKVNPLDDIVMNWNIPKIWDLRLASWLLSPHVDESELELDRKMLGFSHLLSDSNIPPLPAHASDHLHGFVLAIKQLYFLNKVYPLINNILLRNGLLASFEEIESPLLSVLSAMECYGIGFRHEPFAEIQVLVETKLQQLSNEARTAAKDDNFLLSSPQQVSHLLFDVMNIPEPQRKGASSGLPPSGTNRHRSTSEEALKQIQAESLARHGRGYPIIDVILEFRTLNKILTSYIRPFPSLCCNIMNETRVLNSSRRSKKDKKIATIPRIHPMWIQTAVRTGRLSCRKPNMQQIPTGGVLGLYPRTAFVPTSEDLCLFSFDFSQNEVRILANMSGDSALTNLFQSSESVDIYKLMSSKITGKAVDDIDDKERAISKQVSHIFVYHFFLVT